MIWDTIRPHIKVRRHNGQCSYGLWMRLNDKLPYWIEDGISDQILYDDLDEGIVEHAGAAFIWRKE